MKGNKFFEIFIFGALALVLNLLFAWFIGNKSLLMFMILLTIAAPAIAVIAAKYDELPAFAASGVVFGLTWIIFSFQIALIGLISYVILGMAVGWAFRNKLDFNHTMFLSGAICALEFILINIISIRFFKINIIESIFINGAITPFMNTAMQLFKDSQDEIVLLANSLLINIPAIITVISFIIGFIIVIISLFITRRAGYNVSSIEPFSKFRLPISMVWISMIVQILAMGSGEGSNIDTVTMILINLSYVLNFLFMVQGIALADFFFKKWGLRGTLRIVVYLIGGIIIAPFIFIPLVPFTLTIAGVLDSLMDFRKLRVRGRSN